MRAFMDRDFLLSTDTAVSLFVEVSIEEWPEWVQPTGAQDAYTTATK